jgi:hypothetical protein
VPVLVLVLASIPRHRTNRRRRARAIVGMSPPPSLNCRTPRRGPVLVPVLVPLPVQPIHMAPQYSPVQAIDMACRSAPVQPILSLRSCQPVQPVLLLMSRQLVQQVQE